MRRIIGTALSALALAGSALAQNASEIAGDPPVAESSANPAADAMAEIESDCNGAVTVEPGFVRQADVDGNGLNDVVLDWGGLRCDGSAFLYCGSGGCRQAIWLAYPDTDYRLLVRDLIELVELPAPGEVLLRYDGGDCGLSGAELCDRRYDVRDGTLMPLD